MITFPKNFMWGAATSSYQVEGNNRHADWWDWEQRVGKENSGQACRHYELYAQDFDLAKSLNHNTHRLSIEWSRVEPKEGEFDKAEIQHYVDVVKALRERGIEPMVTLHHFTNPTWISDIGDWTNRRTVRYFARYCDAVVCALAPYVRFWITINEPTIIVSQSYLIGAWPPQKKSIFKAKAVRDHFVAAHVRVYERVNKIYEKLHYAKPSISISQHISAMVPCKDDAKNRFAVSLRDKLFNFDILNELTRRKTLDFIGLNYYSRQLVDVSNWWIGNLLAETCKHNHDPKPKNSLNWDIYPEGLYQVLMKLKRYDIPVIITENGICTSDDNVRWQFIYDHLKCIHQAMQEGASVAGYLHWSLLDNFEWDKGFGPRFGLIEVDYKTQQRTVKGSAVKFGEICKTGVLA